MAALTAVVACLTACIPFLPRVRSEHQLSIVPVALQQSASLFTLAFSLARTGTVAANAIGADHLIILASVSVAIAAVLLGYMLYRRVWYAVLATFLWAFYLIVDAHFAYSTSSAALPGWGTLLVMLDILGLLALVVSAVGFAIKLGASRDRQPGSEQYALH